MAMQSVRFRAADGRKRYSLIPDYYDGQGIKRLEQNRRDIDNAQYLEKTDRYDPQFTKDYASLMMQDNNFHETRDWRDDDGRGQMTGTVMGYLNGEPIMSQGSKMNNRTIFHRKFSERYMNYRKDHTMVEPFSADETGLTENVDIDHTFSHNERMRQFVDTSNKSRFYMQHERQAPGETPVDVDTNRNPWMSRGYTGLGSDVGMNALIGDKPINKYQELHKRTQAAQSLLRMVDGDIPDSYNVWSPAVIYQYGNVQPRTEADNEESNPDKHDAKHNIESHFMPYTGLPDKHQFAMDNYALATPMMRGYAPRNPIVAKEYLENRNLVNMDQLQQEVRQVAPQFMRDLMSKIDPAGMESDTRFIEEVMASYPSLQDIQVKQRTHDDIAMDVSRPDSVMLQRNVDMALGDFIDRHITQKSMHNSDETMMKANPSRDLKEFQALGRDFVASMVKSNETHQRPNPVADLLDVLPKADQKTDIFALETRQVANLGARVLADPGNHYTVDHFDTDIIALDTRMQENGMDRSFNEFLAIARNNTELPNKKNKETVFTGAAYAGASQLQTYLGVTKDF